MAAIAEALRARLAFLLPFAERGKAHYRPQVKSRAAMIVFAASLSGLGQETIGNVLGFSHVVLEAGATAYMGAFVDVRRRGDDATEVSWLTNTRITRCHRG